MNDVHDGVVGEEGNCGEKAEEGCSIAIMTSEAVTITTECGGLFPILYGWMDGWMSEFKSVDCWVGFV